MKTLQPEPLTAEAFAPYGDVIESATAVAEEMNAEKFERFDELRDATDASPTEPCTKGIKHGVITGERSGMTHRRRLRRAGSTRFDDNHRNSFLTSFVGGL